MFSSRTVCAARAVTRNVSHIIRHATKPAIQRAVSCSKPSITTRALVTSARPTPTVQLTGTGAVSASNVHTRMLPTTVHSAHQHRRMSSSYMEDDDDSEIRPALTMFTETEVALRESVSRFAKDRIGPHVASMDAKGELEPTVLKELFEQGLMGIEVPLEYGGNGMTFTEACITIEELARTDPAVSVIVDIQNTLGVTSFRKFGSQKQQEEYLPRLATDTLVSFCLSEPGCGSDAFALKTKAEKKGDKWVINGTKLWISNAKEAGLFIIFATIDPSLGYKGITAFLADADSPGLIVGKKEDKMGIRASSTCEVAFEDLVVPEDAVLGEIGKGYKVAIELLNEGRIGIASQMVGLAEGVYEQTMPYLFQREAFGQQIGRFQGMKFSYAQAAVDIEAARLLMYNAARLKDAGQPFIREACMAKVYASQVAERVASQSIEWVGGVGFTKEFPQEKFFRDSKIGSIYEGTTNLQLETIAAFIEKDYS
jgi:short-chain 2-methylacyl-CoA dehydrogenase